MSWRNKWQKLTRSVSGLKIPRYGVGVYFSVIFLTVSVVFASGIFLVFGATNVTTTVDVQSAAALTQNVYRWYENNDGLTPTSALAGENTSIDVPASGSVLRLRMNLSAGANMASGLTFKLQFSNSSSSGFADLGTTTAWVFYDNPSVANGANIATTVLSDSNVAESYSESNPTVSSPTSFVSGQKAEWDWAIKSNSADTTSNWYFRMIYSSSTVLDGYSNYPTLAGVAATTSTPSSGGETKIIVGGGGLIFPALKLPQLIKPEIKKPISPCDDITLQKVDLNGDCLVDLVDLSILLYYYDRTGNEISRYDFNDNGIVDFPDVSVMMFYWTG
ncbi:MAG: hypothetical protein AAB738_00305 [Patescibacteria group bacterium]